MSESESTLESRIKNRSKNVEDYLSLGDIYLDRGDSDRLLELYARASTLPLSSEERAIILCEKGQAYRLLGKNEDAISCCEEYLKLFANKKDDRLLATSGLNYYNLSLLLLYQLDQEEKSSEYAKRALEAFETLLQKYPDYEKKTMIYIHISELYDRFEEYGKAIDSCNKAMETANNDEERMGSLLILGSINMGKGDYQEAEEAYKQAFMLAKEEKDFSLIHFEYGRMYFASNRIQDAIEAFNDALRFLEFDHLLRNDKEYTTEAFYALGLLHGYNNEYDRAKGYLNKALANIDEYHIYYCNTHITLGHCYLAQGEYNRARGHYDEALSSPLGTEEEMKMANECLNYASGLLHYYNNEYDRAKGYLNKALENIDEYHIYYCNTHITLGHCHLAKGEYTRARGHYDGALSSPLGTEEEMKMANECLKDMEREGKDGVK